MFVVFAGGSQRGKSSLINGLLQEEEELCYVDKGACTNMLSVIQYGKEEKLEAFLEDRKGRLGHYVSGLDRFEIDEYTTEEGNPNNFRGAKLLRLAVPNRLLQEGFVFVDSPGVENFRPEHSDSICALLARADVLVFVGDCLQPYTEEELHWLRHFSPFCQNLMFPLCKEDLAENSDAILAENRERLSKALGREPEEHTLFALTAERPEALLEALRSAPPRILPEAREWETVKQEVEEYLAAWERDAAELTEERIRGLGGDICCTENYEKLLTDLNALFLERLFLLSRHLEAALGREEAWELLGLCVGGAAEVLAGAEKGPAAETLLQASENCRVALHRHGEESPEEVKLAVTNYQKGLLSAISFHLKQKMQSFCANNG